MRDDMLLESGLYVPSRRHLVTPIDFRVQSNAAGLFTGVPAWLALTCATTGRTIRTGLSTIVGSLGANALRARSVDGSVLGLAVEKACSQLLIQSQALDNAAWTHTALATITGDTVVAPDGTTTAEKLIPNTSNTGHYNVQVATMTNGARYTLSAWAKKDGYQWVILTHDLGVANYVFFDVGTPAIGNTNGTATSKISGTANGWCLAEMSALADATHHQPNTYICASNAATSFAGDGAKGADLWGLQLEAGAYSTSYLPTTTTTLARAADVCAPAAPASQLCRGGFFDMAMTFAPHFSSSEYVADMNLLYLDTNNRVFLQQSTNKIVLRIGGADVLSSALTWSRETQITVRAVHSRRLGRILTVSGATTGNGRATAGITSAVSLPANAYLMGDSSGAVESSSLMAIAFVQAA